MKKQLMRDECGRYEAQITKKRLTILAMVILLVVVSVYSMMKGSMQLSAKDILLTLMGKGESMWETVVFGNRLPRVATTVLVGAILAVCGAAMQCVLNNQLASASTLGVSQGAAFGAALGIIVFGGGVVNSTATAVAVEINNPYIVSLCAFVFGSLTAVVILILSQMKRTLGPAGLVLAGTAISAMFAGGSTLLQYFADESRINAVVFWTFGNLGGTGWDDIKVLAIVFVVVFIYLLLNRWNFNAMSCGAETAKSLGVNARAVMLTTMLISSVASSMAVAFVGIINFVGLIAPHMMRRFVGDDYRYLIPASALAGALVLMVADTFGRLIIAPVILPVGAITSFLGAPVFLAMLMRGGKRE